ncbi:MAG: hypothetical protein Q9182_000031 [Xanthomendoza sp. 2 TL-2023]
MEHDATGTEEPAQEDLRPFKRRKFYRKRADSPGGDEAYPSTSTLNILPTDGVPLKHPENAHHSGDAEDTSPLTVAEIVRRRKAAQKKRAGIEFGKDKALPESSSVEASIGGDLLDKEDSLDKILTVVDRFAPQTGQVADVDKHMYAISNSTSTPRKDADTDGVRMAYIDSEMAKRRESQVRPEAPSIDLGSDDERLYDITTDLAKHRQPAALGKLHEIDLGLDATLKNIARTEAAKRRLEGGEPEIEEAMGKVRLRKDGKPWRGRRRRNSDDVKRDRLVEEVMKESRRKAHPDPVTIWECSFDLHTVEIYDEPEVELPNDDQAADDRVAEQFRRDFMDAISSRRKRAAQKAKKAPGSKVDDKPRGPKLGGSRSARAAMREQQEKAAKK